MTTKDREETSENNFVDNTQVFLIVKHHAVVAIDNASRVGCGQTTFDWQIYGWALREFLEMWTTIECEFN
jgi:hypothetical protein